LQAYEALKIESVEDMLKVIHGEIDDTEWNIPEHV